MLRIYYGYIMIILWFGSGIIRFLTGVRPLFSKVLVGIRMVNGVMDVEKERGTEVPRT